MHNKNEMKKDNKKVAYFSMEFAFDDKLQNYAGGLGVLSADMILSAADLELDMVGVSLIYHRDDNPQKAFKPNKLMKKLKKTIKVEIEDREVEVVIWQMDIKGRSGHIVPVYFLSTYSDKNPSWDRDITRHLYSSDAYTRLCQETILGIGGTRALRELGVDVACHHLNEGHAALSALENLKLNDYDVNKVKKITTFTTHTPVDAGHDYFNYKLVYNTIGKHLPMNIKELGTENKLGMTELALNTSKKVNSVSLIHEQVCEEMFPEYDFENVTNGIYHPRWVGKHMEALFNREIKGWHHDPLRLKSVVMNISDTKIMTARKKEKADLVKWINSDKMFSVLENVEKEDLFDKDTLTVGFARRMVPYKRADLIFRDVNKLRNIGYKKLQLVFAGNEYEGDKYSNELVDRITQHAYELRGQVKIVFIPMYNLEIAKKLVAGCDIWLNTPIPRHEASGTSGMKAALNGVLNLSVTDGWWSEAYRADVKAGWGFGEFLEMPNRDDSDFAQLMRNLEDAIDCYYNRKEEWATKVKHAISLVSFFNTHRANKEYMTKIWKV
ncbi:alpha-glucan family phosphorylase [Candidatus Parcubacteria bacterium]|nr:MAG: alpha-glucan family phosphorylase [Candidatus Parcubacteria bacterium]